MSRKKIAEVNSGNLDTILCREDLTLSQELQHIEQQRATAGKMARGVTILRIMDKIYEKVAKLPDPFYTIRLLVDPRNSELTVYLDDVDAKAVMNRSYMDWIKAKDEKRVTDDEDLHCLSTDVRMRMFSIKRILDLHGGTFVTWSLEKGTRFTYRGPFLPRARLREFIRTACETADLPWDSWKRFWRRNSKKITEDLEMYFELDSQEFPRWKW